MNAKSASLFFAIVFSTASVFAQKEYAVLLKGDTLKGQLKFYSFDNIDRLQVTSSGKKTTFTALQVRNFVKDEVTYVAMKYENSVRFMKVIKSGYLSLLGFNTTSQGSFDGRYLAKKDGTGMEVPNLSFKKMLSKYLSDCPDVHDRIDKGEFAKRDIEKIVDLYNTCLQVKTQSLSLPAAAVVTSAAANEKILAIESFSKKVDAENFVTKKDVLDLLKDLQGKISKNETIPNYLTEGLKSYLADTPALAKEAEALITLLKK